MAKEYSFDINEIRRLLPHRFPFLLVDRVLSVRPGPRPDNFEGGEVTAIKNVSINEPFFTGHFPGYPIMPGVLVIEAMAQAGGFACYREGSGQQNIIIASINNAKFRKMVVPGDTLYLHGRVLKDRRRMVLMKCRAEVNNELVAEAEILAQISTLDLGEDAH